MVSLRAAALPDRSGATMDNCVRRGTESQADAHAEQREPGQDIWVAVGRRECQGAGRGGRQTGGDARRAGRCDGPATGRGTSPRRPRPRSGASARPAFNGPYARPNWKELGEGEQRAGEPAEEQHDAGARAEEGGTAQQREVDHRAGVPPFPRHEAGGAHQRAAERTQDGGRCPPVARGVDGAEHQATMTAEPSTAPTGVQRPGHGRRRPAATGDPAASDGDRRLGSRFTRKTEPHQKWLHKGAAEHRPHGHPSADALPQTARARGLVCSGNTSTRMDRVPGMTRDAATPITARATTSWAAPSAARARSDADAEQHDAEQGGPLAAVPVGQGARSEQAGREDQRVAVDDPLGGADADVQVVHRAGQRDVEQPVVEDDHEQGEERTASTAQRRGSGGPASPDVWTSSSYVDRIAGPLLGLTGAGAGARPDERGPGR